MTGCGVWKSGDNLVVLRFQLPRVPRRWRMMFYLDFLFFSFFFFFLNHMIIVYGYKILHAAYAMA